MENFRKIEFGEIAELRKEKFNPEKNNETMPCLELEHFEQVTGKINGFVPSSEQKSIKNVFYKGDVLFGKLRPYLRKFWLAEFDGVCSSEVWVLKPKSNDISNEYLFNLIQTNDFIQAANVSSGSKMPRADWDYIINFPFLIINSKSEQKAIAKLLSAADAGIHTTEKLITQKELRKKWLMQQLLTGKKRLKGFDGEWKSEILGNVVNLQHGYQFRDEDFVDEGIPIIKIRNVIGYDLVIKDLTFVDASRLEEFKSVLIENGDLLMSLTGNIGRVVEVKGIDKPMFQNYRVGKFTPIDKQITKAFLKFILSSDILFRQFNGLANQSAQANFGKQDMDKLKFRFPISLEEQTAIAQVLEAADKEISLLKMKSEKLKEQKKGLMQILLTGKKRLTI